MKIFISAAEASSDAHGAQLLAALKREFEAAAPGKRLQFVGVGGPKLQAAGLKTLVDARELLTMGLGEVLLRLPRILGAFKTITRALEHERPDVAVLIDYPDFHFRLARRFRKLGIPVIHFIPPKVWVWRSGRLKTIRKLFQHVLCIFPFEADVYEAAGISHTYVGNPLLDELPLHPRPTRAEVRAGLGIGDKETVFAVMPGSRPAEVERHLDVLLESCAQVAQALRGSGRLDEDETARVLIPLPGTLDFQATEKRIQQWCGGKKSLPLTVNVLMENSTAALLAADLGLLKSGTTTLEAALLGCPHLVVYSMNRLTQWVYENIVRYKGPVALSNLVLDRSQKSPFFFREFVFDEFHARNLVRESLSLLTDETRAMEMREAMETIRARMGVGRLESPSVVAARAVLQVAYQNPVRPPQPDWQDWLWTRVARPLGIWLGSLGWSLVNASVRLLKSKGVLQPVRLPSRVISVGNIQAGGAGKTPLVAKAANDAAARGLRVCILTRGYRSEWEHGGGVIAPMGHPEHVPVDVRKCGDEAALLHELCPFAWIGVGADRVRQYQRVGELSEAPMDWVILDDGFQNWKIAKDVDIVAVTGRGPAEMLHRDFPKALHGSNLVVWTKGAEPRRDVSVPSVQAQYELKPAGAEEPALWLVTAVADAASVKASFEEAGYRIKRHLTFEDHYFFREEDIEAILLDARDEGCWVGMTGKDWVKWKGYFPESAVERSGTLAGRLTCRVNGNVNQTVLVLEPSIQLGEGREQWERTLWGPQLPSA